MLDTLLLVPMLTQAVIAVVADAMSYVWGVAFSKDIGAEKAPRSVSARCVSTVYAFMALIIVNTYCANLMAFLVQDDFVLPINGITDPKVCSLLNRRFWG